MKHTKLDKIFRKHDKAKDVANAVSDEIKKSGYHDHVNGMVHAHFAEVIVTPATDATELVTILATRKHMKYYSIGEIYRLKLLKNFDGNPYKDKASVSKVVNTMKWVKHPTRHGYAKMVSEKDIKERNKNIRTHRWGWVTVEALRSVPKTKPILSRKEMGELL